MSTNTVVGILSENTAPFKVHSTPLGRE
uniref:Uncharacterized protein n=1 Tax=Anguilla anguilla TaxID=7936 RepID=A0A0E9RHT5_ANGAN